MFQFRVLRMKAQHFRKKLGGEIMKELLVLKMKMFSFSKDKKRAIKTRQLYISKST